MIVWAMTDLPEPDSPTSAVTFPGSTRKLADFDRIEIPGMKGKRDPEILDAKYIGLISHRRAVSSPVCAWSLDQVLIGA